VITHTNRFLGVVAPLERFLEEIAGYPAECLESVARLLDASAGRDISTWCIFHNRAMGAATADALTVRSTFSTASEQPHE